MGTLTAPQRATLKTAILADPVLGQLPANGDSYFTIAAAMNANAAPDFFVWRTSVPMDEIMRHGCNWTFVDNLTVGKARIWEWMQITGVINPSEANVRAGILATFTTAGQSTMRVQIFGHCQRLASRVEKLFASGPGTAAIESGTGPATMGFVGPLSFNDVQLAMEE